MRQEAPPKRSANCSARSCSKRARSKLRFASYPPSGLPRTMPIARHLADSLCAIAGRRARPWRNPHVCILCIPTSNVGTPPAEPAVTVTAVPFRIPTYHRNCANSDGAADGLLVWICVLAFLPESTRTLQSVIQDPCDPQMKSAPNA